ncbi:MAG: glycosyltransferase family 2 protein [Syntrophorhabdales bacterium]|jgi:glycosyltransferase involved in cell wall biosynthesis
MTRPALVSVIIPTYNYGRYLEKAIRSCIDQTYRNVEVIVVDDGSTDDTRKVVEQFGGDVFYLFQENAGVSAARNAGLRRAKGEFIVFLDADDFMLDESIALRVEILQRYPDIGVVFTDTSSCDTEGNLFRKEREKKDSVSDRFYEGLLLGQLRFQTGAAMVRSSIAKRFEFPLHLSNGEDIVYFSKVFFTTKAYFISRPTVVNLHHDDSLRHRVDEILRQDMALVTTVLDDPFYRGALEYMRKDLTTRRHLELFRRLYLSGEGARARRHYWQAISARPASLLKISYLSKFVKSFLLQK